MRGYLGERWPRPGVQQAHILAGVAHRVPREAEEKSGWLGAWGAGAEACIWRGGLVHVYRCTLFYRALLDCALQIFLFVFLKKLTEDLWQLCVKQAYELIFPTAFAYFLSLCPVLITLTVFQTLHQQKDYSLLKGQMMVNLHLDSRQYKKKDFQ